MGEPAGDDAGAGGWIDGGEEEIGRGVGGRIVACGGKEIGGFDGEGRGEGDDVVDDERDGAGVAEVYMGDDEGDAVEEGEFFRAAGAFDANAFSGDVGVFDVVSLNIGDGAEAVPGFHVLGEGFAVAQEREFVSGGIAGDGEGTGGDRDQVGDRHGGAAGER